MKDYKIVKYSSLYYNEWNAFVENSKNGTFLFHRGFMEYHQDRFEDYSLLIYSKSKLIAILPANKINDVVYSHKGLTYGGVILSNTIKFEVVIAVFSELLKFLSLNGVNMLILKQLPVIYNSMPADEIQYLNFILKSELIRRDILSVINLNAESKFSRNRLEGYKRAKKHNLIIKEENDFEAFWQEILIKNLKDKHHAKPVHSLEEIVLLKKKFPKNIRQFNVYQNDKIVAGSTIFETKTVAHSQYISGNNDKNQLGSLDFLYVHLISEVFNKKKYFDFGISNEKDGKNINKGLLFWKEGFGARTVTQDFFKIDVNNYPSLKDIMI